MRALTISQPFAWLIANGHKPIENRKWFTSYRGPVLIHAGRGEQYREGFERMRSELWPELGIPAWEHIERSRIVAVAELVRILPVEHPDAMNSPWAEGPWCWFFADVRPLARPVPCKGELGLWTPLPMTVRAVMAELERKALIP